MSAIIGISNLPETRKLSYSLIEHGSELDTRICFAVGEINRAQLEETAIEAGVTYDKWTTDDNLRAEIIDAARNNGGIKIFDVDGGCLTLGFTTGEALPAFDPSGEVPIPARNFVEDDDRYHEITFEKVAVGNQFYDSESGEVWKKQSPTEAEMVTGGDHGLESTLDQFPVGHIVTVSKDHDRKLPKYIECGNS